MDPQTQKFIGDGARSVAEAAADLGALISAPGDLASAAELRRKLSGVCEQAHALGLAEIARLAAEGAAPLERVLARGGSLDRIGMQTVGWAVQSLDGLLAAAAAQGDDAVALAA